MIQALELDVPARPEYIAIVRLVVSSLASARRNLADQRVDDLKLAVSEACTNAIEAHAAADIDEPVVIRVLEADERLEVQVSDSGGGFDPDDLPRHPPVTDPERLNFERGLGIPLIRTLIDGVEFINSDKGTTVRMVFFGGPAGDTGDETSEILRAVLADEE
ncbi:MAG TPA: ATP-binding protein [Acidimicrobiales bacterium]|nr:ATP-binding protein [Acidimicrobiales bacterium]